MRSLILSRVGTRLHAQSWKRTCSTTAPAAAPAVGPASKDVARQQIDYASATPEEILKELDAHIIGQAEAKKAVAVAMRNRWRRAQVEDPLRSNIIPKNILMIGPTGVGKTEVARRMAKLTGSPFIKVEATKYTEVGFRGADVDSIIKDLAEAAIHMTRAKELEKVQQEVTEKVQENLLDLLIGKTSENDGSYDTFLRNEFRKALQNHEMEDIYIKYEPPQPKPPTHPQTVNILGLPQQYQHIMSKMEKKQPAKKMPIKEVRPLEEQQVRGETVKDENIIPTALKAVEEYGIVFIDEIDKIAVSNKLRSNADASDEGVQRDLLPLLEGTKIQTEHGDVDTSKILFVCAGAFHVTSPSDLLAELQGRLPIRVTLEDLSADHLYRILCEPQFNLVRQHKALFAAEDIDLEFTEEALRYIAQLSYEVNVEVENIGARRLFTVMEKVLEDLSFNVSQYKGQKVVIDVPEVQKHLEVFKKKANLRKYIL